MKESFKLTSLAKVGVFALASYAAGFIAAYIIWGSSRGISMLIPLFIPGLFTLIYMILIILESKHKNSGRDSQIYIYSLLLSYFLWIGVFGYSRFIANEVLPIQLEIGLPLFIFLLLFLGIKR